MDKAERFALVRDPDYGLDRAEMVSERYMPDLEYVVGWFVRAGRFIQLEAKTKAMKVALQTVVDMEADGMKDNYYKVSFMAQTARNAIIKYDSKEPESPTPTQ